MKRTAVSFGSAICGSVVAHFDSRMSSTRTITLIEDDLTNDGRLGALDTGVSHAIALAVGLGTLGETLRIHPTTRVVAFGRQDAIAPGYARAVATARAMGYDPIERLAGGRAAIFHTGTLGFSWAVPAPEPRTHVHRRFETLAEIMCRAFADLGVDARVGEVDGEYCPGAYSVNVGGRYKVMGVGQRLVRGAAHVGGVVVVKGTEELRSVLGPVYGALDLSWQPEAAGALEDATTGIDLASVRRAILHRFGDLAEIATAPLPDPIRRDGVRLAPGHASGARR
jgi:lipoate-protein ligase A